MSDRYAVMGNPIAHSKSPIIHHLFAEQTSQDLSYEAILVPQDGLVAAIERFTSTGSKGLNITVPFKLQACELVNRLSTRAKVAGAVNTISIAEDGSLDGDNTDGVGLVNDLMHNYGANLSGKRILILGAGGAARGIVGPLLGTAPNDVVIANRTL